MISQRLPITPELSKGLEKYWLNNKETIGHRMFGQQWQCVLWGGMVMVISLSGGFSLVTHFGIEKTKVIMESLCSRDCLLFYHWFWENTLLHLLYLFFDKFTLKTMPSIVKVLALWHYLLVLAYNILVDSYSSCIGSVYRCDQALDSDTECKCWTIHMYACMYVYCFCVWLYGQNVTDIVYVVSKWWKSSWQNQCTFYENITL